MFAGFQRSNLEKVTHFLVKKIKEPPLSYHWNMLILAHYRRQLGDHGGFQCDDFGINWNFYWWSLYLFSSLLYCWMPAYQQAGHTLGKSCQLLTGSMSGFNTLLNGPWVVLSIDDLPLLPEHLPSFGHTGALNWDPSASHPSYEYKCIKRSSWS